MSKKRTKQRAAAVAHKKAEVKRSAHNDLMVKHQKRKLALAKRAKNIIKLSKNGLEVETSREANKSQHQKDFEAGNCVETNISSIKKDK